MQDWICDCGKVLLRSTDSFWLANQLDNIGLSESLSCVDPTLRKARRVEQTECSGRLCLRPAFERGLDACDGSQQLLLLGGMDFAALTRFAKASKSWQASPFCVVMSGLDHLKHVGKTFAHLREIHCLNRGDQGHHHLGRRRLKGLRNRDAMGR